MFIRHRRLLLPVLLTAAFVLSLGTPLLRANVALQVSRGPGAQDVQLDWSGGQPNFAVFRSSDPTLINQPVSWIADTTGCQWVDVSPVAPLVFYSVMSEGSCAPGLILCAGECVDTTLDDNHCGA